jgi:hypothetical protein
MRSKRHIRPPAEALSLVIAFIRKSDVTIELQEVSLIPIEFW